MNNTLTALERQSELLRHFTENTASPDEALANIWKAINTNVRIIYARSRPYDAFAILANVRLYETVGNIEFRQQFGHEGRAASVEIAAVVMMCRPSRHMHSTTNSNNFDQDDAEAVQEVIDKCRETLEILSTLVLVEAIRSEHSGGYFEMVTRMRDLNVRNLSYPDMVADTNDRLFGTSRIESACKDVLGYSGSDFLDCFEQVENLLQEGIAANLEERAKLLSRFQALVARCIDAESANRGGSIDQAELQDKSRTHADLEHLWSQMWSNPSHGTTFTAEQLVEETGLGIATVKAVLDDYSMPFGEQDPVAAIEDFYCGKSDIKHKPLLVDSDGNYTITHTAIHMEAFREMAEARLKFSSHWDAYQKVRGRFLECESIGYLEDILKPDSVYRGIEYMFPSDEHETLPQAYSEQAECDALLLLDDAAFVVEAKAGAVGARDKRRNWVALRTSLHRIVSSASSQAGRIAHLIDRDGGLQTPDQGWLDLKAVKAIYPITVSLEELTGIVTVTAEMLDHGLLDADWIPWTISLHDLRIIRDIADSPAEFTLYLATRRQSRCIEEFRALDELDIYLHFHAHRLAPTDAPGEHEATSAERAPQSSSIPETEEEGVIRLLSHATTELDAWYLSDGPKPTLDADPNVLELVSQLCQRRLRGWLRTGMILLSLGRKSQEELFDQVASMLQQSQLDGQAHSVTFGGSYLESSTYVLALLTSNSQENATETQMRLKNYIRAKKYQLRADAAAGLLLLPGKPLRLIHTYYLDEPWIEDNELHKLSQELGLRPDQPL